MQQQQQHHTPCCEQGCDDRADTSRGCNSCEPSCSSSSSSCPTRNMSGKGLDTASSSYCSSSSSSSGSHNSSRSRMWSSSAGCLLPVLVLVLHSSCWVASTAQEVAETQYSHCSSIDAANYGGSGAVLRGHCQHLQCTLGMVCWSSAWLSRNGWVRALFPVGQSVQRSATLCLKRSVIVLWKSYACMLPQSQPCSRHGFVIEYITSYNLTSVLWVGVHMCQARQQHNNACSGHRSEITPHSSLMVQCQEHTAASGGVDRHPRAMNTPSFGNNPPMSLSVPLLLLTPLTWCACCPVAMPPRGTPPPPLKIEGSSLINSRNDKVVSLRGINW